MDSFTLQCFGVGDGMACADRNHSSYLYRMGGVSFLIDCGEPVSRNFQAQQLDWNCVDRIFLSHLHSDHVGGFFMLMQGFWLGQRTKSLPVHVPKDAITPLRQMLQAAYLFDELFKFELVMEPLEAGQIVSEKGVRITPFRTSHLDSLKKTFQAKYPGDYAAYSFLIEADGKRIVHSADLGSVEDLDPLLAKPVDLLVCELSHFSPRTLFNYLKGRSIGRVIFTHLGRVYWENLEETKRMAQEVLSGAKFSFARDLDVFEI